MQGYLDLLSDVKNNGAPKSDRTGVGTYSVFVRSFRHDLSKGFPLLTTKKLFFKGVADELLWFLSGSTNYKELEKVPHWWRLWADRKTGDLGPTYGFQWRNWPGPDGPVDQVALLIDQIRQDPDSRRHLVSAWNPGFLPEPGVAPEDQAKRDRMALAPCHALWQVYINEGKLSLSVYQRSADVFIGVPNNIASYALLTHMLCEVTGYEPGEIVWTGGDCHLYRSHLEQADEQLSRTPKALPRLIVKRKVDHIDDFRLDDFALAGYKPEPAIKAPLEK